jgi:ribonucleotide monophosphatase NagD (HAD superfamily)
MDNRPKTIICDIDGTLIKHYTPDITSKNDFTPEILEGTLSKFNEWEKKGYRIILMTARKKSMKTITKKQLSSLGIFYDELIMGVTSGERYLINDMKTNNKDTAFAINLIRDNGINNINI